METDHIELRVPDRRAAVAWYQQWLGYRPVPEYAAWAESGPLMLTNDGGRTLLAVFDRGPTNTAPPDAGWQRLALRAPGGEFLEFGERFAAGGHALEGPVDHAQSWSWYFDDPWGNAWEVTTYDYAAVAARLGTAP